MLQVTPIGAFNDNYIWLLRPADGSEAWVVDPGDAAPVLAELERLQLELAGILITHHHFDHVGGIEALRKHAADQGRELVIYGPDNPAIDGISHPLREGDCAEVLDTRFTVYEVPGHTLDHIAYFAAEGASSPILFCGDTLFAGGCGRLFEGQPEQMWNSLLSLRDLPDETLVYCAHEYTLANLDFARVVEPDNQTLLQRIRSDQDRRRRGEPTVPSRLAIECSTNPFLRADCPAVQAAARQRGGNLNQDAQVFAEIRAWKDSF